MKIVLRVTIIFLLGIFLFTPQESLEDLLSFEDVVEVETSLNNEVVQNFKIYKPKSAIPLNLDNIHLKREIEKTKSILPTLNQVRSLSSEKVHHNQNNILNAGMMIGLLYEKALKSKVATKEVSIFFNQCANDKKLINSVRGLCLAKNVQLKNNDIDINNYPKRVQLLALRIING